MGRHKKRYGPVKNRGVRLPPWRYAEEMAKRKTQVNPHYLIRCGTDCLVRRVGEDAWHPYKSKVGIVVQDPKRLGGKLLFAYQGFVMLVSEDKAVRP